MEIKITFRKAESKDLKQDKKNLKIGQVYAVSKDNGKTVNSIFSLKGNEDPFILKHYLDREWILIPENCKIFEDWIKEQ